MVAVGGLALTAAMWIVHLIYPTCLKPFSLEEKSNKKYKLLFGAAMVSAVNLMLMIITSDSV